ncbi:MAG: carbohydrate ABC transporter permease [Catonella sp.]
MLKQSLKYRIDDLNFYLNSIKGQIDGYMGFLEDSVLSLRRSEEIEGFLKKGTTDKDKLSRVLDKRVNLFSSSNLVGDIYPFVKDLYIVSTNKKMMGTHFYYTSEFFILPQYQIIQGLGLLNSLPALFLPNLFSIFGTFLLRQFFKSLPDSLEDAARIDGCNRFMIYYKIMLPLVKSGLVALGILTLRFAWNDLMWPLIVNTSEQKMTLAAGLSSLQGQYVTDYPLMMAGAVMSVAPLLILFAIFQEQFIEGIALSGVKG